MPEIRAVVSQCGVAMELHGHLPKPITIVLIRPAELKLYREELGPTMRHAVIGQLAVMYARRIFQNVDINPHAWTYNASEDTYSRS